MKNSKLLAKSITLGLILAMPYSVVSADDIVQESYSVGLKKTVTGKGNITISGNSYIAGELGVYNKELGAKKFTTGQLGLDPTGVIYVDKLKTTSESAISTISTSKGRCLISFRLVSRCDHGQNMIGILCKSFSVFLHFIRQLEE